MHTLDLDTLKTGLELTNFRLALDAGRGDRGEHPDGGGGGVRASQAGAWPVHQPRGDDGRAGRDLLPYPGGRLHAEAHGGGNREGRHLSTGSRISRVCDGQNPGRAHSRMRNELSAQHELYVLTYTTRCALRV